MFLSSPEVFPTTLHEGPGCSVSTDVRSNGTDGFSRKPIKDAITALAFTFLCIL